MRKVIVWSYKGGVGKTTTAVNLAGALAKARQRVLLIDLDPQAHSSVYVDCRAAQGADAGAVRVLDLERPVPIMEAVQTTAWGFDVLTGHDELLRAERSLRDSAVGADFYLRDALVGVEAHYDIVVMDAGPSKSLLTTLGLVAADTLIVPQPLESMALEGLAAARRHVALVKRANANLQLGGVVIRRPKDEDAQAKAVRASLAKHCPELLLKTEIRTSAFFGRAYDAHQVVQAFAPGSIAAADFDSLVTELGARGVV